ncbi:hypothetical protein FE783_16980 [Paenibacillus mesophilus]|uniref:hypothetical protein n=1 Tax=Paenibacillus mesophilus TaxID=2582849 RepID=UPI00110E31BE|nr:hypothetical protein [Paenibacillus mesophilus]TMV48741.1 hypothetical protein FE783_16980 [Paenibacillus mesophilus]
MITPTQSADDMVLIRNLVILPVVLSAFESDRTFFASNSAMTPYVRLADLTISRIHADIERLTEGLKRRGIEVYAEKRNRNGINRTFRHNGKRNVYSLYWGAFDAEIALLTDYYLGLNIDAARVVDREVGHVG